MTSPRTVAVTAVAQSGLVARRRGWSEAKRLRELQKILRNQGLMQRRGRTKKGGHDGSP